MNTLNRNALVGIGRRAIVEGWYGNRMDYQSGIAAICEQIAKTHPEMSDSERNDIAVELGNEAMTEIESEAE